MMRFRKPGWAKRLSPVPLAAPYSHGWISVRPRGSPESRKRRSRASSTFSGTKLLTNPLTVIVWPDSTSPAASLASITCIPKSPPISVTRQGRPRPGADHRRTNGWRGASSRAGAGGGGDAAGRPPARRPRRGCLGRHRREVGRGGRPPRAPHCRARPDGMISGRGRRAWTRVEVAVDDPTQLTLTEAGEAIAGKQLSPVELTDAYLARVERLNPELTAYVTVTADRARDDARHLADELAHGTLRGPLHGIPIGLKDLIDTAGIQTAAGTAGYHGRVPGSDAAVARRLRDAGTVLLGKTATHELAYGVITSNVKSYGTTRNPWNTDHIPGGSSGGSGAAIVASLAAGAI